MPDLAPLALFLSGELGIAEFKSWVDDRLFALRQSPCLTKEKTALARIQLSLHKLNEGGDIFQVYMAAQGVADTW